MTRLFHVLAEEGTKQVDLVLAFQDESTPSGMLKLAAIGPRKSPEVSGLSAKSKDIVDGVIADHCDPEDREQLLAIIRARNERIYKLEEELQRAEESIKYNRSVSDGNYEICESLLSDVRTVLKEPLNVELAKEAWKRLQKFAGIGDVDDTHIGNTQYWCQVCGKTVCTLPETVCISCRLELAHQRIEVLEKELRLAQESSEYLPAIRADVRTACTYTGQSSEECDAAWTRLRTFAGAEVIQTYKCKACGITPVSLCGLTCDMCQKASLIDQLDERKKENTRLWGTIVKLQAELQNRPTQSDGYPQLKLQRFWCQNCTKVICEKQGDVCDKCQLLFARHRIQALEAVIRPFAQIGLDWYVSQASNAVGGGTIVAFSTHPQPITVSHMRSAAEVLSSTDIRESPTSKETENGSNFKA